MSKNSELNDIIYCLKTLNRVYFEADQESFECEKQFPKGYVIKSPSRYIEVTNLSSVKGVIRVLGKTLTCL